MLKHQDLIGKMTPEEKAALLSGKNEWQSRDIARLDIPSILFSDGPNGVRKQEGDGDHLGLNPSVPATCFPTSASVANSWDPDLAEEVGAGLGEEARARGVDVLLGPGVNMKRSPLCGRNFEYFSEDPYLTGKMAAACVRGIQSRGVYACLKHFAVNNQELRRMAMNAVVDERTLREIYLTAFEIALKEGGARCVMTAYNEVNGTYANENVHLLQEILRGEWGYDGLVITDWGGSNDHVSGVAAGSDLEMPAPGLDSARQLLAAVSDGRLRQEQIDACVDRLLDAVLDLTKDARQNGAPEDDRDVRQDGALKDDRDTRQDGALKDDRDTRPGGAAEAHHELAYRAARESVVLLKNEGKILPLKEGTRIAVVGEFARLPRYQGAGSSKVNATQVDTILQVLDQYALEVVGTADGYSSDAPDEATAGSMAEEAAALASRADVVLYFFGLDEKSETEGRDRTHMRLPKVQTDLLEELSRVNPNIVGILSGGSPVEMPWECGCRALVHGYLSGQAGACAMMDILTGRANPSGKLAETYPLRYEDTPAYESYGKDGRNALYREGPYIGYRYYDTAGVPVRYPFGYGLSYTEFTYSDLRIDGGCVRFTLTNTGSMDGAEIAQVYLSRADGRVFRPRKELKGFVKAYLKVGESRQVQVMLDEASFRFWNIRTQRWEIEGGTYRVLVGASAADPRLSGEITISQTRTLPLTETFPYEGKEMGPYLTGQVQQVDDAAFAALLGYPVPTEEISARMGMNDTIGQMEHAPGRLARFVWRRIHAMKAKSEEKGEADLNLLFIYNMPFRAVAKMTEGMVSMDMAEGIVEMVNGQIGRGLRHVIGGFFRNRRQNREYEEKLAAQPAGDTAENEREEAYA